MEVFSTALVVSHFLVVADSKTLRYHNELWEPLFLEMHRIRVWSLKTISHYHMQTTTTPMLQPIIIVTEQETYTIIMPVSFLCPLIRKLAFKRVLVLHPAFEQK